jgi:phosphoribosylamine--glycine ligase
MDDRAAATVMVVSGGYPGAYEKGKPITLPAAEEMPDQVFVYHAGTRLVASGTLQTNGGRVLAITAMANSIQEAAAKATQIAAKVRFEGSTYRRDIGYEFKDGAA